MLEYFVTDSDAKVLVTTKEFLNVLEDLAKKTGRKLLLFDESLSDAAMVKQEKKLSSSAEKTEQVLFVHNQTPLYSGTTVSLTVRSTLRCFKISNPILIF